MLISGFIVLVALAAVCGALVYFSSPEFKETARQYAIREIEKRTGGQATLSRLSWNLWSQRIHLLDLTLRGMEPVGSAPLAHIESVEVGVNLRSLFKHRIDLFELTVTRPEIHLSLDANGNTNLPNPPPQNGSPIADYQLSIENFKVAQGIAFVNERRLDVDFVLKNVESDLTYQEVTRIMTAHTSFDGVLELQSQRPIPYSFSADWDFTRGTMLAKKVVLSSAKSSIQLQGRINNVLTREVNGKLEYTGNAAVSFLNFFYPKEKVSGTAAVTGALEFAKGYFYTHGKAKGDSAGLNEWKVTAYRGDYDYRYPDRVLKVENLSANAFGGNAQGSITVGPLPGQSKVSLDLKYSNIDGSALARVYPWDPKYRLESRLSGQIEGWFEGRFDRYQFTGGVSLTSIDKPVDSGIVSLPLNGTLGYVIRPGQFDVNDVDLQLKATSVLASGHIQSDTANLRVRLNSTDLSNLAFLYPDANGAGSFDGMISGPVQTPKAEGDFDLKGYRYRDWTIEHATGTARVDLMAKIANLTNVRVTQGQSQITLAGTTNLDGSQVDLRIQSAQVNAKDVQPFIKQDLEGTGSGSIHLTSLNPLRFDGDVRAIGLAYKGQTLTSAQSHVQYDAPSITLQNLSATDGTSTLTGRATYNTVSEAITFAIHVNTIDLKRFKELKIPETIEGVIQQADLTGTGTLKHPQVAGNLRLQNLSFFGETFPMARVDLTYQGTRISLKVSEMRNLDLTAEVDTGGSDYEFSAQADFRRYSIERLAGFKDGTLTVSGDAMLKGKLKDLASISGSGHIDPVEASFHNQTLRSTKPFTFEFDSKQLTLGDVVLLSDTTKSQLNLKGTVALAENAKLDLSLTGEVPSSLFAPDPAWTIDGDVSVKGKIGGTLAKPDLQGQANLSNMSIARVGTSVKLTEVRGEVVFNERIVTLNNVEGHTNGGTIQVSGSGAIEGSTIGALNLFVEANGIRLRIRPPGNSSTSRADQGMSSVFDGTLNVGGTLAAPSVSGDLRIRSFSINSNFDEFIAFFQSGGIPDSSSPFGDIKLSLHVSGSKNITIHNELASAEARVELFVRGTVDRPSLTGHVETSKGTLVFNGRNYDVTRGNIDFVDPLRIDPNVDILAETTVRNYRVYLSISGRVNQPPIINMRSEPPLPLLEIVNLISGGKTTEEFAQAGQASTAPTGEQVFQGGAASILSDMLVSRVGSKFNLMGLDRYVRIDPMVVGAHNTTTARVTYSQQFTKDLTVTISEDLASYKQQIVQIEYFISRNVSILASKDENDALSLDLRIRRRF